MTARLRLVQLVVQPVVVADDGTYLTPMQIAPLTVAAADLDGFPTALRAQMADLEAQMNEGQSE